VWISEQTNFALYNFKNIGVYNPDAKRLLSGTDSPYTFRHLKSFQRLTTVIWLRPDAGQCYRRFPMGRDAEYRAVQCTDSRTRTVWQQYKSTFGFNLSKPHSLIDLAPTLKYWNEAEMPRESQQELSQMGGRGRVGAGKTATQLSCRALLFVECCHVSPVPALIELSRCVPLKYGILTARYCGVTDWQTDITFLEGSYLSLVCNFRVGLPYFET
jgi:hypothetical protein